MQNYVDIITLKYLPGKNNCFICKNAENIVNWNVIKINI